VSGPPPVPPLETPGRRREEIPSAASQRIASRRSKRTAQVAIAAMYAALYVTLALAFGPISYGQLQMRVANVLLGLIPILGWPAVIGQGIGVFLANMESPLGPIDLLNAVPSVVFSWVIWKLRRVSVFLGLTIYSAGLGVTVALALSYAFHLPFELPVSLGFVTITLPLPVVIMAGIFGATAVLGYIFYRAMDRTGIGSYIENRI